jgi:hypothetical protein
MVLLEFQVAVGKKARTFKRPKKGPKPTKTERFPLTRFRGRAEYVTESDLIGCRDQLVSLEETTWYDVGWKLERLRDKLAADNVLDSDLIAELRDVFRLWNDKFYESYRERCPPLKMLLRAHSITEPPTATNLYAMSSELNKLGHAGRDASTAQQEYRNLRQLATSVLAETLRPDEKDTLQIRISKLDRQIREKEGEYVSLAEAEPQLRERFADASASFAQFQLVDFLRKHRNRLTPLRVANAIAGLPYVGWRQSAKRCTGCRCQYANGLQYRTLKFILSTAGSRPWQTDISKVIEKRVYGKKSLDPSVTSELKRNWPSLRSAIETVLATETKDELAPRPYRIASQYFRRIKNPSQIDSIVAQIDRVISR